MLRYMTTLSSGVIKPICTSPPLGFSAVRPRLDFGVVELFAGAGGLALGMERAGLSSLLLNEVDKHACETLRRNRPRWNVLEKDVAETDFSAYQGRAAVVAGGFPCQAFSYAGKQLGLNDARGTLFYEFARAVKEIRPLVCLGENVRGLLNHDNGATLQGMIDVLDELGYEVVSPQYLRAEEYFVPQKRERLFLVGLRRDAKLSFSYPKPLQHVLTLRDALKAGKLYDIDVPESAGARYPRSKEIVLERVPPGGCWRDLPVDLQKSYMKKSFYLGGGRAGIARRISWEEPCLTLMCSPAQKLTERCHPDETRPFTVREYARIQTFPDNWIFSGPLSAQYRQIGNAVPVNLAFFMGQAVVKTLNEYVMRESCHVGIGAAEEYNSDVLEPQAA